MNLTRFGSREARLAGRLGLVLSLLGLMRAGVARGQAVTEFPLPTAGSFPLSIAAGPDGNLWFTEFNDAGSSKIGRITTAGVLTEFSAPPGLRDIAAGSDGNLWFTELGRKIGRMTRAGVITEFLVPNGDQPLGIASGPDGNLWFTSYYEDRIGRITTAGVATDFGVGGGLEIGPTEIVAGPDGNLWFTEGASNIGRITTAGVATKFPTPSGSSSGGIAVGSDGNLWFTESVGKIGRITPAGVVTEFPLPSGSGKSIAAASDGNLWFTESGGFGRITTAGAVTEYHLPFGSDPGDLAAGPDGNLWFTVANRIGRIVPGEASGPTGPCVPDATTLCLNSGRFSVQAHWQVPSLGTSGHGTAVPLTGDTGSFWFFDSTNIEIVVKVLNACSVDGHYWIFAGGLTNVGVTMTVTDTQTGIAQTYLNPAGIAFQPIQDTSAFSTCP